MNKMILKKVNIYKYIKSVILFVAGATLATGCVNDDNFGFDFGDGTSLTLLLPDALELNDTRANEETSAPIGSEGNFSSLWLFGFPQGEGNKIIVKLSELPSTVEGRYRVYRTNITSGKYKFYLFANLDKYLSSDDKNYFSSNATVTEDNLKNITISFSSQPLPGSLPMVAFPENIDQAREGVFTITAQTNNIVNVNMKFLCAKVRHTILFDNSEEGISSAFHNNIIDFGDPFVSNLNLNTPVAEPASSSSRASETWGLKFGKYEYPDHDNYPRNGSDNLYNWNTTTNGSWAESGTKAWQYTVYVPEDLSGETLFSHPYSISTVGITNAKTFTMKDFFNEGYKVDPEIRRSKMYDVVSKITKSDFSKLDTTVEMEDWDLNEISYYFHGPYELVVESPTVYIVSTVRWTELGLRSNVEDKDIKFEFPKIKLGDKYVNFYYAEIIKPDMIGNDGKEYDFSDDWASHMRIRINPDVPYQIIKELRDEEKFTDAEGKEWTQESLSYYHIVAANIHKRIDVEILELLLYLNVSPQTIIIDTREYFSNGIDSRLETNPKPEHKPIEITFATNYDGELNGIFTLQDPLGLFTGVGENDDNEFALKLKTSNSIEGTDGKYSILDPEGTLLLEVRDIIKGNEYWDTDHTYTLTFTLTADEKEYKASVKIIVKPFVSNYIIHFHDATGTWNHYQSPHIFVYQDLLLPSDLLADPNDPSKGISRFAGKIVGYIENNTQNADGINYNAAAQYVFSNNISFKGWKNYGGPDINDPWDNPTLTYTDPYADPDNKEAMRGCTMGFVMFGTQKDNYAWNDDYGYTNRVDYNIRHLRYHYDVNFNAEHEKRIKNWYCDKCLERAKAGSRYAGTNDDHDYPGIQMEDEGNGWWRYTLTGVAEPGKTMIIFANSEEPWSREGIQDDNRYPGDYETGLPLFDFEDNEGWFIFNGKNSKENSPTDHHFYDDEPEITKRN